MESCSQIVSHLHLWRRGEKEGTEQSDGDGGYDGIKSRESVWHMVSICDSFSNNVPTGTNGKDFNNAVVSCGVCDNIMIINWER